MIKLLAKKDNSGQVALETLLILVPWIMIVGMFFNLLFLLGSLMMNQATVNRAAYQIASLGCVPLSLQNEVQGNQQFGMKNTQLIVRTTGTDNTWSHNNFIDSDNNITGNLQPVRVCRVDARTLRTENSVKGGKYIYVRLRYNQKLLAVSFFGLNKELTVNRSALTVSQALRRNDDYDGP